MQIKGWKDKSMKDGVFLINLCAAVEPRVIDWDLVTKNTEDEEKIAINCKYAISLAKKLGAIVFAVWEDVLEMNGKMMLIFVSTMYELYEESHKQ